MNLCLSRKDYVPQENLIKVLLSNKRLEIVEIYLFIRSPCACGCEIKRNSRFS